MRRFLLAAAVLAAASALTAGVLAGAGQARAQGPAQHQHHTPDPGPQQEQQPPTFDPGETPTDTPTAAPTPLPTETFESTAPVPTGPAVGTESTPGTVLSVPAAHLGPTPEPSGGDVTLVVLLVIIGLALAAIGAFVLAIALQ